MSAPSSPTSQTTSVPAPHPRRQPRSERTRARILAAAERHFAEQGFAGARLADIAGAAGIRRAAIFYHFRDKRELYRAVLDDAFGELLSRSREALGGDAPPAARLESGVETWVEFLGARPAVARLLLREAADPRSETRADGSWAGSRLLDDFYTILAEGQRTRTLDPIDLDPFQYISAVAGMSVFYVAALPALTPGMSFDHLSPEALGVHKRDVLRVARRLLGLPESAPAQRSGRSARSERPPGDEA